MPSSPQLQRIKLKEKKVEKKLKLNNKEGVKLERELCKLKKKEDKLK